MTPTQYGSRPRPRSGFELWSWYFMRVSGVVLLLVAVFHLLWMHLTIGLSNITFNTIVARYAGPWGPFWRVYDLALLAFALTHGMNGLRWVINDYVRPQGLALGLKSFFVVLYVVLILMGAYVILTFSPPATVV